MEPLQQPGTHFLMPVRLGCCKLLEHLLVSSQLRQSYLLWIYLSSFTSPFLCLKPLGARLNKCLRSPQNWLVPCVTLSLEELAQGTFPMHRHFAEKGYSQKAIMYYLLG